MRQGPVKLDNFRLGPIESIIEIEDLNKTINRKF
jgi:hypothetical protein